MPDAGDILVSRTVRDLVVGSGTGFDDRGVVELRGVPGSWELLAVESAKARRRFGRSNAGIIADARPTRRDAPVRPRGGGDGEADPVDPAWGAPPRPDDRASKQ